MTTQKPEWFRMTENEAPRVSARKAARKAPFAAFLATGALVLGGAVFANAHDEQSAQAETTVAAAASTTPATTNSTPAAPSAAATQKAPAIGSVPNSGTRSRHDGEERDHEGRERSHSDDDERESDDD